MNNVLHMPLVEGISDDEELYFGKHADNDDGNGVTNVLSVGNHSIKYRVNDPSIKAISEEFFIGHPPLITMLLTISVACIVGVLGSFPYATYYEWISTVEWVFFCVLRTMVFAFVFISQWVFTIFDVSHRHAQSTRACTIMRHCVCTTFATMYSVLYSIKWMELNNVLLWQATIGLFTISWFNVFYGVINYRLGSSNMFMTTSMNRRIRSVLLSSVKSAERIAWKSREHCDLIFTHFEKNNNIGVLIAKHVDGMFYNDPLSGDKLDMYETSTYDMYGETRTSFIDLFIGLSLPPLTLALLEDYGYPLHKICKDINCVDAFDWVVFASCSVLAILYSIATYDIHHNNARKLSQCCRTKQDMIESFKKLVIQSIPLGCACIVATTRLNASYSIFGRIAGKFGMPYSIGLPFIYILVAIVFIIDTAAAYKIICRSYKKMISIVVLPVIMWAPYLHDRLNHLVLYYYLRYYFKRLKWFIKNCDEDMMSELREHIL